MPLPLERWIGRSETTRDTIGPTPMRALGATLDHPPVEASPGTPLPPLWHWLYFLPLHRQSEIGADGHAKRGGFMPDVALPRRMWAASAFEFRAPIRVGDSVERTSTIDDVAEKSGRSGALVFVRVRHALRREGEAEPALVELHDIVYREAKRPGDAEPPPQTVDEPPAWRRTVMADEPLLFRYSALTLNGHRIHYDRSYATGAEGYPGLVVHGPLIATLLLDLLRRESPAADVASFSFKALRPTFDGAPLSLNGAPRPDGGTVRLWAEDRAGALTMDATAVLR